MIKRLIGIFLIGIFIHPNILAQRFGANPSSLKWLQRNDKATRIIFSPGAEDLANRIGELTTGLSQEISHRLGMLNKPINIVLQPNPLVSNAYVGLAPWRSEFYLTPMQNSLELGSTNWIDNLAVHEYRHVHQYSNFRKGLSRFAYVIAGEEGQALANAAAIPDWFFEGDAVYAETKYLSQGRGRLPYFFDQFNAIWQADKNYSFQKLRNGSLRDVIPNHYQLGYLLVNYGYTQYGEQFWGDVTNDAVRYKGLVYPFQRAIKKYSGVGYTEFVREALNSYKLSFCQNDINNSKSVFNNSLTKSIVEYYFPAWTGFDSVVVLQKAYNEIPTWVMFNAGSMTKLGVKEIGLDDYFTYKKGQLVYTALHYDPRWIWKEFNDITLFDLGSRSSNFVTHGGRYFSPDLSNEGNHVVAVSIDHVGRSSLHVINVAEKSLQRSIEFKNDYFLSYPCFSKDDQFIFSVARKKSGESAVVKYSLVDSTVETVFPFVNAPIAFLRVNNNKLIFTASQSNRNEIWSYDLENKSFQVLSSESTGSYTGGLDSSGLRLVYTRPTVKGKQLFIKPIDSSQPVDSMKSVRFVYENSSIDKLENIVHQADSVAYQVSPYSKMTGFINVHSWRPYYERPEWSFSLYSQNVLNTFQSSLNYVYNENEKSHKIGLDGNLGTWYPWVVGGTDYTSSRSYQDNSYDVRWNEWTGHVGLRLPLNFTAGKFYRQLDMSANLYGVGVYYDPKSVPLFESNHVTYLQQQIVYSAQSQQAVQHIYPHLGVSTRLLNQVAVGNTHASQLLMSGQAYLPGLGRNHSIVTSLSYQRRDTLQQYIYANSFSMARGYEALNYPRMWKATFNYHMPLVYPDMGFANIIYVQRIRSNFFYDAMRVKSLRTGIATGLRSTGVEIFFDTKWWNQQPVTFGVRYSRLIDADQFVNKINPNRWEFILPVNLIPN